MPDIREYLTARQVVAIYGIERSTLYRLAKLGKIPCINLGIRLMRFKRSELDLLFHYRRDLKEAKELPQKKLYSLEPEDCYTIGEVCEKYHINSDAEIILKASFLIKCYMKQSKYAEKSQKQMRWQRTHSLMTVTISVGRMC